MMGQLPQQQNAFLLSTFFVKLINSSILTQYANISSLFITIQVDPLSIQS